MIGVTLLIKSVVFPMAVKAMAVMSSSAVVMSAFSLVLASIAGYSRFFGQHHSTSAPHIHINAHRKRIPITYLGHSFLSKQDDNSLYPEEVKGTDDFKVVAK